MNSEQNLILAEGFPYRRGPIAKLDRDEAAI